ncbi:MAG: sulfatase [Acidobacteria bacterium]|nr:sulfatase [Acidobacteriota bacterium]
MRKVVGFVLTMLALPAVLAAEAKPPRVDGPNIVLITIDTLRADHLSCYGYPFHTSPNIDKLAGEGVRFQNAYSPIPLTGPAHIALMTSLYPQQHGATINGMHMSARPQPVTLAQILHRLGYRTAAFVSAWPVKKGITGLGRGFDVYNQKFTYRYKLVNAARDAKDVTTAAQRWLKKRNGKRPFFLWLHYFDPHEPYVLRPEFADLPRAPRWAGKHLPANPELTVEETQRLTAYDSEVAHADRYVGKVLQLLSEMGIRKQTLIVLTADHGESLGENEYWGHGDQLYQPIVHIPLILSYLGTIPQGVVLREDAGLLDVMPTILDYVGIPARLPIEGQSFKPIVEAALHRPAQEPVYFLTYNEPPLLPPRWISWVWTWAKTKMTPSHLGFASRNLKVVLEEEDRRPKVYRLDTTANIERSTDGIAASQLNDYGERLNTWFQETNRGLQSEGKLSEEDLEMLRSLGYLGP